MGSLVEKYKTIFLGNHGKARNSWKTFSFYQGFLEIYFEIYEKSKWNFLDHGMLVYGFRFQNLVNKQQTILLRNQGNLEIRQNLSCLIGVSYKFISKSVKNLNWIWWVMEYWFKSLQCKIWLMNKKPVFSESKGNLEAIQKLSSYIGVSHQLILKFLKSFNQFSGPLNICSRLCNAKFARKIENHYSENSRLILKTSTKVLLILEFPINCFELCEKPQLNLLSDRILAQSFLMGSLVEKNKTIFLGNHGKPRTFWKTFSFY